MNDKTRSYPLKLWLPVSNFLIFIGLSSSLLSFNYYMEQDLVHQQIRQQIQKQMERVQLRLETFYQGEKINQIERELSYLSLMPQTQIAVLIDVEGRILLANNRRWKNQPAHVLFADFNLKHYQQARANFQTIMINHDAGNQYLAYIPIMLASTATQLRSYQVGVLYFVYDYSLTYQIIWQNTLKQALFSVIIMIIFMLILLAVQHVLIRKPLKRLMQFTQEIGKDNMIASNPLCGKGEFMTLGKVLEQSIRLHQQREQNLAITLNSIGDAVITTDNKGYVTRMNPIAEQLTGWLLTDAKGLLLKTIFPIIDASTGKSISNPVEKVISTGETVYLSNHTTLIAKDGTEYQIADSAAPICDDHRNILGMVLVFNDVTEKYKIRQELNQTLQRLKLHWQDTPLGIIEWNTAFECVDLNPAAEHIFGFKKAEIQGQHAAQSILPESEKDAVDLVWTELLNNTGGRHSCNQNITKDGKIILCQWYNTPLINEDGQVIGVSSLIMDITEQTRLARQEQDNKTQLQKILNSLLTMVATLSPEGIINFINEPPLSILGLTEKDVINTCLWHSPWFAHDKSIQSMIERECLSAAAGKTVTCEVEILTLEGKIWVDFSLHPIIDEKGHVESLVAEGRDASRRKLAEEHAIRSQKMASLSKIVGGIAHDYNNMLGVISGYTGLLKRKCQDVEGADKFIREIIHATERGKKLTQKMLNFSRPEAPHAASCNLNQSLRGFYDILAKSITSVITLNFDLADEDWLVWVDVGELEDAVLNMVINAKYAMPEGGRLTITTNNLYLAEKEAHYLNLAPNDYVKLSINDTGAGIDDAIKNKIFDPFFTTKGEAGNGLGLSQVFGFVERAGGAINVYSQIGKGTQFSLYFPRFRQFSKKPKSTTKVSDIKPRLTGDETILVVDDEPALRELARQIFLDAGYRVFTASDGQQALNLLRSHQTIDLVLSDVIMPNIDGYQLAQKISQDYPKIKIQLTSGFTDQRHNILNNPSLKQNIIDKPYDSQELLTRCRILLDKDPFPK